MSLNTFVFSMSFVNSLCPTEPWICIFNSHFFSQCTHRSPFPLSLVSVDNCVSITSARSGIFFQGCLSLLPTSLCFLFPFPQPGVSSSSTLAFCHACCTFCMLGGSFALRKLCWKINLLSWAVNSNNTHPSI